MHRRDAWRALIEACAGSAPRMVARPASRRSCAGDRLRGGSCTLSAKTPAAITCATIYGALCQCLEDGRMFE